MTEEKQKEVKIILPSITKYLTECGYQFDYLSFLKNENPVSNVGKYYFQCFDENNEGKIVECLYEDGVINRTEKSFAKLKIMGLCKNPNRIQLELIKELSSIYSDHIFSNEKFDELFKYSKNNWDEEKFAFICYDKMNDFGVPINPIVLSIMTK